jgi:hypothetical protein
MKKVAILQSNYIPWKGYFDLIASVDEFILYDDMQFTKNDWRNRNMIKTPKGLEWLSIPVGQNINRRIRDVFLIDSGWNIKHWKMLHYNYVRANYFNEIKEWLEPIYLAQKNDNLSFLNRQLIEAICNYLKIKTKISNSWDYNLIEGKSERLADLCLQTGSTHYLSGPSAKNYLDELCFEKRGIEIEWFDYSGYPEYSQLWGNFVHGVSVLDLLFNEGANAFKYMKNVHPD